MKPTVIQVYGGGYLDLLDPDPELIRIEDIAHALSNLCRFTGHVREFYSVAQHSVLCAEEVHRLTGSPVLALQGLLHDAHEAYTGDDATPKKHAVGDPLRVVEGLLAGVVRARFGLPAGLDPVVHRVDLALLATERRDLLPPDGVAWDCLAGVDPIPGGPLRPWSPREARAHFLAVFGILSAGSLSEARAAAMASGVGHV